MTYALSWLHPELGELADRQVGVLGRGQLRALGISSTDVTAAIDSERWIRYGERVVICQNVPPTGRQLWWAAVLHASDGTGVGAALCAGTSLLAAGLSRLEVAAVHVVVRRGVHVPPMPGIRVHESRRFSVDDIHPTQRPPRTRVARSAIDEAAWATMPSRCCAVLAMVVQQRLTTVEQLQEALDEAGRVRHRRLMLATLGDIQGGAHSLAELRVGPVCRRAGLREPDRQTVRRDAKGRKRYLDCEWELPDGRVLVLEVDGAQHMEVEHWWADMQRERSIIVAGARTGRAVLRCSGMELRVSPQLVTDDLAAMGVPTRARSGRRRATRRPVSRLAG